MKLKTQNYIFTLLFTLLFAQTASAQMETNSALWAMGYNYYGQLGDGTYGGSLSDTNKPETIVYTNVMAVAGGGYHSLFILTNGSLWAVGNDNLGQLGDGTNGVLSDGNIQMTNKPEMIVSSNVTAIAAGLSFSMFIKSDGSLWGMGDDSNGELGDDLGGSGVFTNKPEMIITNGVSAVACGLYHTLFLKTNGTLWAMGSQSYGQLGDGFTASGYFTNKPELITNGVVAIVCGGDHSLFINTNGDLYAMGDDGYGQLGDGLGTSNATPVSTNRPEFITNGVVAIAAGEDHSLFIRTNGSLWAMGNNFYGQLGDGTTNESNYPEMIVPSNVTAIACGYFQSFFIKNDGSLWAMGADFYGELGDGKTGVGQDFGTNAPEMIVASGVLAIAGGFEHTLFIAPATPSTTYTYTVSSSSVGGGTVSSSGVGGSGSTVIVTATNSNGYAFVDWTSNGVVIVGSMSNYSVTLNTNVILVANFAPLFTYTTSASPVGGGTASLGGTEVSNSSITVTATNNSGYVFGNWTSNGVTVSATTNYTFSLNTNVALVAHFLPPCTLTVLAYPPDGGTVSSGGTFPAGTTTNVTATPNTGFTFIGWIGDATGTNNPLTVTLNTNLNIVAYFAPTGTTATVSVTIVGDGTVSPDLSTEDLRAGNRYTLTARASEGSVFSNWTGSITTNKNPLTFKLESSLALQANFITNPFPPFVGIYNGLFTNTNGIVTEQTAGMIKGLHINSKGTYTGSLLIDGASHGLSGAFSLGGTASNFIARPAEAQGDLEIVMTLNGSGPFPRVTGTVTGTTWMANLAADLATNTLPAAEYTMLIPPDTNNTPANPLPGGDGYALITNYPGTTKNPGAATAKITGALADGTAFNETVPVSGDGYVPIYANLYSGRGLLLGWINLELTNTTGVSLTWIHPERATGLYQSGFTNILFTNQILLSPWTNPPGNLDLLTNFAILTNINDTNTLANFPVTISALGELGPSPVTGSINLKTGLLRATIAHGETRTIGYGAILLNATNGGGYYLTPTDAQAIQLGQ